MSGLFGTPSIPEQKSPLIEAKSVDESAANAAEAERKRRAAAYGHQQTILTAGKDLGNAPVRRKTLLGGA